jgi:hypothetical protein
MELVDAPDESDEMVVSLLLLQAITHASIASVKILFILLL